MSDYTREELVERLRVEADRRHSQLGARDERLIGMLTAAADMLERDGASIKKCVRCPNTHTGIEHPTHCPACVLEIVTLT